MKEAITGEDLGQYSKEANQAILLLKKLISTPSFSREEQATAQVLHQYFGHHGITANRLGNNVWVQNRHFDKALPTLLLNSHHDTVKPNKGYTRPPFQPAEEGEKLYGLGSNDAGGSVVTLLWTFLHFYDRQDLKYNILFAASAEEEISGEGGIAMLLPELGKVHCAIVGEPTQMEMAIAEKGLLVLDCTVNGVAGHAAREEGENAIYKALPDIEWFRNYRFEKRSELLGDCKMSVTMIDAGVQHNIVPPSCSFTVDIRVNDCYSLEEILTIVKAHVACSVQPRSLRLRATKIDELHPLVQAGQALGKVGFGSATLSDKALMPFPTLKMGPGSSVRSHAADEYILRAEIEEGLTTYIALLNQIL